MREVLKSMLSTALVIVVILVAIGVSKVLSMIPFGNLQDVFLNNWLGLIIGIILSHVGIFFSTMGQRRRRRKDDDDEEI